MTQPRAIPRGIRSKQNTTGGDLAAKLVVIIKPTAPNECKLPAADTDPLLGLTTHAVGDDEWVGVQTEGQGIGTSAAAIAAGARLMTDTAGKVKTWSAGGGTNASVVGIANTATSGADEDVEIELAGPAADRQG